MVGDANEVFSVGLLGIDEFVQSAEIWSSTLPDGDPCNSHCIFLSP